MNWINPREILPESGQVIWILNIETRQGEGTAGNLPCARIRIAQAAQDDYGVIFAKEVTHKGYSQYSRHFFEWWHYYQEDTIDGDQIYTGFDSEKTITAWMPYIGLPKWDIIGIEESKEIIQQMDSYKKAIENKKHQIEIDKHIEVPSFISLHDHPPVKNGSYVVVTKKGVSLLGYDISFEKKWFSPEGDAVIAWYPIPDHY